MISAEEIVIDGVYRRDDGRLFSPRSIHGESVTMAVLGYAAKYSIVSLSELDRYQFLKIALGRQHRHVKTGGLYVVYDVVFDQKRRDTYRILYQAVADGAKYDRHLDDVEEEGWILPNDSGLPRFVLC